MSRNALDWTICGLALAAWVVIYALAGQSDYEAAQITEQHVQEVEARRDLRHPCDGITIRQWAATERWHPKAESREPECVERAKALPAHLLSMPCNLDAKTGRCRR